MQALTRPRSCASALQSVSFRGTRIRLWERAHVQKSLGRGTGQGTGIHYSTCILCIHIGHLLTCDTFGHFWSFFPSKKIDQNHLKWLALKGACPGDGIQCSLSDTLTRTHAHGNTDTQRPSLSLALTHTSCRCRASSSSLSFILCLRDFAGPFAGLGLLGRGLFGGSSAAQNGGVSRGWDVLEILGVELS